MLSKIVTDVRVVLKPARDGILDDVLARSPPGHLHRATRARSSPPARVVDRSVVDALPPERCFAIFAKRFRSELAESPSTNRCTWSGIKQYARIANCSIAAVPTELLQGPRRDIGICEGLDALVRAERQEIDAAANVADAMRDASDATRRLMPSQSWCRKRLVAGLKSKTRSPRLSEQDPPHICPFPYGT